MFVGFGPVTELPASLAALKNLRVLGLRRELVDNPHLASKKVQTPLPSIAPLLALKKLEHQRGRQ